MAMSNSYDSIKSIADLDALDRSRRHMLASVAAATTLWLLPEILRGIFDRIMPHGLSNVLILAGVAGSFVYMFFMFRFHRFQTRVLGDPELRRRLYDERVLGLKREAIYRGWFVMIIAVAMGIAVAPFVEIPDQVILLVLMLLGVNAPIVFFLFLDRG